MKIDFRSRIRHLGPRQLAILSGLIAIYTVTLLFWLMVPRLYRSPGEWEPYHIVTTDLAPADAEDLLVQAGLGDVVTDVITEHTTEVFVTRFNRVESVPLSDALRRLDPLDPRRDPFIENLSRYFTTDTEGQSLIYLRADGPTRRVSRVVRRVLGRGSDLVGWEPLRLLVGLGLLLAASAAILVLQGRFRLVVAAGLVPWIPVVFGSGIPGAVGAALICFAWSQALTSLTLLLERNDPRREMLTRVLRLGVWPGLVIIATLAVVWSMAGVRAALTVLPGVIGLSVVTALVIVFRLGSLIHRDHDLFAPVSILTGRSAGLAGRLRFSGSRVLSAILGLSFLVIPPVVDGMIVSRSPTVPHQVIVEGAHGVSYESISVLWSKTLPDALVDISDYTAHRAYQQSLAFGRPYKPPAAGEAVTLSRFRETEEGAYNRFEEVVLVFDETWLEQAISDAPAGISSLLASAGKASGVVPTSGRGLYSDYSQLLKHTAYVLLALVPAALSGRRLPRIRRGGLKVVEIARRRKQVA
jgi:hypothetical protein